MCVCVCVDIGHYLIKSQGQLFPATFLKKCDYDIVSSTSKFTYIVSFYLPNILRWEMFSPFYRGGS